MSREEHKGNYNSVHECRSAPSHWPKTVDDAVSRIIGVLSDEEKRALCHTQADELIRFHFSLGKFICNEFGLNNANDALMKACARSRHNDFERLFFLDDPDEASGFIIEEIWKRLNSAS